MRLKLAYAGRGKPSVPWIMLSRLREGERAQPDLDEWLVERLQDLLDAKGTDQTEDRRYR
ncbi:hypothetical protein Tdes44962_MAKER01832 [Teratosphaeria destructans]|uniref:Uncharacterized protein n=1 Tax=Teratosphaeria destructans TaxID=418781 RepID=A0A9W7W4M6_9PEZI|nr:hypothetical protein Tdes44962_MAKER01832 [Teratosphaeria destructans]